MWAKEAVWTLIGLRLSKHGRSGQVKEDDMEVGLAGAPTMILSNQNSRV